MGIELSAEIKALRDGPNHAYLATLMPDGSPHVSTVWVARDGDRILTGIGERSLKGRNTRRDPRGGVDDRGRSGRLGASRST